MTLPSFWNTGVASVANGDTTITFSVPIGTADAPVFQVGDKFVAPGQPLIPELRLASVDYDAGTAELSVDWPGTSLVAASFEVRFIGDSVRSSAQTRKLIELLGQVANTGIGIDAFGVLAGRSAYDTQAANFTYLSTDGDGVTTSDPVVFIKNSATSGDWSAAITINGTAGGDFVDVVVFGEGLYETSEVLQRVAFAGSATFPAGLSGSQLSAGSAPIADAVLTLKKNGSAIGTVTFAASSTAGTATFASAQSFGAGDVLEVVAPSPADAALSDVSITLRGTRDASGQVAQTGTATLDFGSFPGATDASVAVTGIPRIQAASLAQAWLWPAGGTADHTADEHKVVGMRVLASSIVAGTGFSIFGITTDKSRLHGQWNVAWRWS